MLTDFHGIPALPEKEASREIKSLQRQLAALQQRVKEQKLPVIVLIDEIGRAHV